MEIQTDSGYAHLVRSDENYAIEIQTDATFTYIAQAKTGAQLSDAVWKAKRVTTATGTTVWADGNSFFDNVATDLTKLTYDKNGNNNR